MPMIKYGPWKLSGGVLTPIKNTTFEINLAENSSPAF